MEEPSSVRVRLARELHDGIAQELAAIGYKLDEVIGANQTPQLTRAQLREIRIHLSTLTGLIRDEIFQLRGLDVRPLDLVIESIAEAIFAGTDINVSNQFKSEFPAVDRNELIKIIQEALINIKNHASATHVEILQDQNFVKIRDNGDGPLNQNQARWGIQGMKERAALIGAHFEFTSDESGTLVTLIWNSPHG